MKKYYLHAIFFIFSFFGMILATSCNSDSFFNEEITIELPPWNGECEEQCSDLRANQTSNRQCSVPRASQTSDRQCSVLRASEVSSPALPQLSRWLIQIQSGEILETFFTTEDRFCISVPKNQPLSITATPLTKIKSDDGNLETCFFYPAGAIYPYDFENKSQKIELTWQKGCTASLMQNILQGRLESEISGEKINDFLKSFNWKKLQETLSQKIESNLENLNSDAENTKFYNPWQIDFQNLLENLCNGKFSSSYLEAKNVIRLSIDSEFFENAGLPQCAKLWSPYIPENFVMRKFNQISVQKNITKILNYENSYAVQITISQSKKMSVALTYMPIFNSEL